LDNCATNIGQLINLGKCFVLFGTSCTSNICVEVVEALHVTQEVFESKYLGVPTPEVRMSKEKVSEFAG
jgi:hypothetical protein